MRKAAVKFLFGVLLAAAASAAPAKQYKLGVCEWVGWSPMLAAQEKGFWTEQGLEVHVLRYEGYVGEQLKAFAAGVLDFTACMAGSAFDMAAEGHPVIVVVEIDRSHGGHRLIVKQGLKLPELKGKKIGVYTAGSAMAFFLHRCLGEKGLSLSEVEMVEMSARSLTESFIKGDLDAIVNRDPEAARALREGNGSELYNTADFPNAIPEVIVVRKEVLETSRGEVAKLLIGWYRAVQWCSDPANKMEYYDIIRRKMFRGEQSDASIDDAFSSVRIHVTEREILTANLGGRLEKHARELFEFMRGRGKLQELQAGDCIDLSLVHEAMYRAGMKVKPPGTKLTR